MADSMSRHTMSHDTMSRHTMSHDTLSHDAMTQRILALLAGGIADVVCGQHQDAFVVGTVKSHSTHNKGGDQRQDAASLAPSVASALLLSLGMPRSPLARLVRSARSVVLNRTTKDRGTARRGRRKKMGHSSGRIFPANTSNTEIHKPVVRLIHNDIQ